MSVERQEDVSEIKILHSQEYNKDEIIHAIYMYEVDIVGLISGAMYTDFREYNYELEDVFSHEAIHRTIYKITDNIRTAVMFDNLCYYIAIIRRPDGKEMATKWCKKLGILLEDFGEEK